MMLIAAAMVMSALRAGSSAKHWNMIARVFPPRPETIPGLKSDESIVDRGVQFGAASPHPVALKLT
ncbi:MAG: hypothetical protein INF74_10590 [Roseomonas sp.]|nr:hypothetical protein [Roseomonas sp.]